MQILSVASQVKIFTLNVGLDWLRSNHNNYTEFLTKWTVDKQRSFWLTITFIGIITLLDAVFYKLLQNYVIAIMLNYNIWTTLSIISI